MWIVSGLFLEFKTSGNVADVEMLKWCEVTIELLGAAEVLNPRP